MLVVGALLVELVLVVGALLEELVLVELVTEVSTGGLVVVVVLA